MTNKSTKQGDLFLDERPIISIKEARKKLGQDAKSLDDKSILDIINELDKIAHLLANNNILDKITTE